VFLCSYKQSLNSVKAAMEKFDKLKIPYQRPVDFYAEMVKTDKHMTKVKSKLVLEQKKIQAVEDHKKQQLASKYSKQARAHKEQEQARLKKQTIQNIKNLRKLKAGSISNEMVDNVLKQTDKKVTGADLKSFSRKRKAPSQMSRDDADDEEGGFREFSKKSFNSKAKTPKTKPGPPSKFKKMKQNNSRPGKNKRQKRN
jgi:rRNA-processing protein EBP2